MYSLKEIKSIIMMTECKELLCEGLCCSEPIITMGEKGLIDNYFIFACDLNMTVFSKPMISFGIYSDIKEVAYINNIINIEDTEYKDPSACSLEEKEGAYELYSELYPIIRSCIYRELDGTKRQKVVEYYNSLKAISGKILWGFYCSMYKEFFEWYDKEVARH